MPDEASTSTEPTNVVNIHDPFFLWGILEHPDRTLIQAIESLAERDLSHLYWSSYYHKRSTVCDRILDKHESIRAANDAVKKLSELAKTPTSETPDLSDIAVPFPLPTSPDFLVQQLRDGSYIPSKGKPLKFTAVDGDGKTKT